MLGGTPPSDEEPVDGRGRGDEILGGGDVERTLDREAGTLELGEPGGEVAAGNGGPVSCFFASDEV